ncbi:MAG: RluA family pseudouridine synthase [Actinomycetia bacterium]|nr:RluA family pseudouridine synthase [Actinomycetes bacterium]
MTRHKIVIGLDNQGLRLDAVLSGLTGVSSRADAVRLIESGAVEVNDDTVTSKRRILLLGDRLTYLVKDPLPAELHPENLPLDIRFEDDYLVVLSKAPGMVCHPSPGHETGTLVNALVYHYKYENLAQIQGDDRPGIVHRLDKDTSGLMVVAKTDETALSLQDAIRLRELDRRYLALVHGFVSSGTGLIDAPLSRSERDRLRYMVSNSASAREAITSFTVLERFEAALKDDGYSLLECKLFTGRTHQIRAHMAYTKHPCVGDPLYGRDPKRGAELGLTRQFLHSCALDFAHPITGEQMRFRDRLPEALLTALSGIPGNSLGKTAEGERLAYLFDPAAAARSPI